MIVRKASSYHVIIFGPLAGAADLRESVRQTSPRGSCDREDQARTPGSRLPLSVS